MSLRLEVGPLDRLPRFYGGAYRRPDADLWVCYPVPLNIAVSLGRSLWHFLQGAMFPDVLEAAFVRGYRRGHQDGLAEATRLIDERIGLLIAKPREET